MNPILQFYTPTFPNILRLNTLISKLVLTVTFLLLIHSLLCSNAYAEYDLSMSLQIGRLNTTQYGASQFTPVTIADAGDLIQYRATYSNPSGNAMNDVFITFPIPYKMIFTGEAYPASVQATIDGVNYADMPLLQHEGDRLVLVPYTQYKSLRWHIKHLPAHKSATVFVNAVVEDMP